MKAFVLLLVLLVAVSIGTERVSFVGHKVVDVNLQTLQDLLWIRSLPDEETDGVQGVDVWTNDGVIHLGHNTIRLTPAGFQRLSESGILFTVKIDDLEQSIKLKQQGSNQIITPGVNSYDPKDQWFYKWHGYDEISAKLKEFSEAHPNILTFIPSIGISHEGRNIVGVKISNNKNSKNDLKRVVLTSGTHAREWIAEGVSLWTIASLVEQYETDPEIKRIIDSLEIYIFPCYNPDGYEYSRATNRYWRKNRRVNGDGSFGVDQNRNWNSHWCETGASKSTSSDIYCGPSAFSEPEVVAMTTFISKLGNVSSIMDMHSNAQLILRPWGWTSTKSPDEVVVSALGKKIIEAIKPVHGTTYESVRAVELYIHSGTAVDGNYQLNDIKKSYVIELAGDDFVVPESDIQRQGEEVFEGFKVLFKDAIDA